MGNAPEAVIESVRRDRRWYLEHLAGIDQRLRKAEEQAATLTMESQDYRARIAEYDAWLAETAPAEAASVAA